MLIALAALPILSSTQITILIGIVSVSITAMVAFINIYKKKEKPGDMPGCAPACNQKGRDIARVEELSNENYDKLEELNRTVNEIEVGIGVLKTELNNSKENVSEIKGSIRGITNKLDDLLKQLMNWNS